MLWSWLLKVLTLLVPFAMRTIVLYTLGNLYLGLGSLFSSVLQVLNLAELGVGSALAFAMYKPAAEDDTEKLCLLLNLYKITYMAIGAFIAVVGLILMPFLPYLISGEVPSDINIYVLYGIYLASTVSSYWFFAYRGTILKVYQRSDITDKIDIIINLITYGIQIGCLYAFKNYYVYVFAHLCSSVLRSCVIALAVKKLYPNIIPKGKPSKEMTKAIFKKAGAVMGHKVGDVAINSIDNILVSAFLGLTLVAQYNNYYYIFTAVAGFVAILSSSLTPIVGNYLLKEIKEKSYRLFEIMQYGLMILISVCCCCFVALYQPFITFWVGEENVLPIWLPLLLTLLFLTQKCRIVLILFKDAAGLWEKDWFKPWLQAIVNLIIDLWLLQTIGIYGAPISSIVATFGVGFFIESYVVHKDVFVRSQRRFILQTFFYIAITFASCAGTYFACKYIDAGVPIVNLIIYFVLALSIGCCTFVLATFWTPSFKDLVSFAARKFNKRKRIK